MAPLTTHYAASEATIHLSALKQNLDYLKRKSGVEGVMAVVKANAYGHGAVDMARFLEPCVDQFAVATLDEGIQLRREGIAKPVLIFGVPGKGTVRAYTEYRLTATVCHIDHFGMLAPGTAYQINFDTGMRRVGLVTGQAREVVQATENHPELDCKGIYSHYATADDPGSQFVFNQHALFQKIREVFPPGIPAHMSNTAAVLHYEVDHLDLIRVGIGLAGYAPGRVQDEQLTPVLDWQTTAVQVRRIAGGEPVSYTGLWKAPQDGWLATLPVGYGDGVPRSLGNRLQVEIGGEMFPVVGTITMDYCMVFLGEKKVETGSKVRLMGRGAWGANEWAAGGGTITHEILCGLTPRVRRRYRSSDAP